MNIRLPVEKLNRTAKFELRGFGDFLAGLQNVSATIGLVAEVSTFRLAQQTLVKARRYCPESTGRLRKSGQVVKIRYATYEVRFGEGVWYAVPVHEHPSQYSPPSWRHTKHGVTFWPPGTGPKFLEKATIETGHRMLNMIGRDVKAALSKAWTKISPSGAWTWIRRRGDPFWNVNQRGRKSYEDWFS